jgi:N-carbamoylputrescine amidase
MTTSTATSVSLGLVQMRCTLDPEENLEKAVKGVREAAAKGAEIVWHLNRPPPRMA